MCYTLITVKEERYNKMLDKAIIHGKEHRKMYYGSKAIAKSCRNHGSCDYCQGNRSYKNKKREQKMLDKMREWEYN
jgi:hypothetical protein